MALMDEHEKQGCKELDNISEGWADARIFLFGTKETPTQPPELNLAVHYLIERVPASSVNRRHGRNRREKKCDYIAALGIFRGPKSM